MNTLQCMALLTASMTVVLAGCSDNPASFVTPREQGINAPSAASSPPGKGTIDHSVEGGGWWDDWGKNIQNTITASEYASGTFGGMYTVNCGNLHGHDRA